MKCQDCGKTQEIVGRLEKSLMEVDRKVERTSNEIKRNHLDMKKIVGDLEGMNRIVNEKVDAVRITQNEIKQEHKNEVREVKKEIGEVKKQVKDVKENLSKVNKDVDEVKVMMRQVLEKLNMLEHLNKLPSPTKGMLDTSRKDILIAGGNNDKTGTEIFSWEKNGWFEVSPMNEEHVEASSFIYKDQIFVVGGEHSKTIETLDLSVLYTLEMEEISWKTSL